MCFKSSNIITKTIVIVPILLFSFNMLSAQKPMLMFSSPHTKGINSANFSPDGKYAITAASDGNIKIWDVNDGRLIKEFNASSRFGEARFIRNGKQIVSLGNEIVIFDVVTGETKLVVKNDVDSIGLQAADISFDGKNIIAITNDNIMKIWEGEKGKLIYQKKLPEGRDFSSIGYSNNGQFILLYSWCCNDYDTTDHSVISILDNKEKKIIKSFSNSGLRAFEEIGTGKAYFSPDSKFLLTYGNTAQDDWFVKIYRISDGELIQKYSNSDGKIVSAKYNPVGNLVLISVSNGTLIKWDPFTGKTFGKLIVNEDYYLTLNFDLTGNKIISTGPRNVEVFDASDGHVIKQFANRGTVILNAYYDKNGDYIIISKNPGNDLSIWNATKRKLIYSILGSDSSRLINSWYMNDPERITATYFDVKKEIEIIRMWDANNGRLLNETQAKNDWTKITYAKFTYDGKMMVIAGDSILKFYDTWDGKFIRQMPVNGGEPFFSPDFAHIVTTLHTHSSYLWNSQTGSWEKEFQGNPALHKYYEDSSIIELDDVMRMRAGDRKIISSDSKFLITSAQFAFDSIVRLWDLTSGELQAQYSMHDNTVFTASFSPDDKYIVSGTYDNSVVIWDVATGKRIREFKENGELNSAIFSPDGKFIATITDSKRTTFWDVSTGSILYSYTILDNDQLIAIDDKGRFDGTPEARKNLYFTCGLETIDLEQLKDRLWIPGLVDRINRGEEINSPTLDELNLCDLLPKVEEIEGEPSSFQFSIEPRRGGLGEVVLFVNGIEVKKFQKAKLLRKGNLYFLNISKSDIEPFFVDGSENSVMLRAGIADNTLYSRGVIVEQSTEDMKLVPPDLFIVSIGVSDYKGEELDLKYASKDASDMSNAISSSARKLLNTDGKEHVFVYSLTTGKERDHFPEKKSIQSVLKEIGKKAKSNDILLLFFAGHGITEGEKKQFYFLTADASKTTATSALQDVGISTAELTEWIKPENIRAQKRVLIFDACNSGQAIKDFVKMGNVNQQYMAARNDDQVQQIKAIDKLNEQSGLFILSASASSQQAYEMGRYSQGLLTYGLLKAIKQQPDILEDGKYLDLSRWFNAARKTVSDLSRESGARQEPQIVSNTNFNIGIVDEEVIRKIVLPMEKPLFAASNFQNADENIADDNLALSKLINLKLYEISSRGADSRFVYVTATNDLQAYMLSGRYQQKGEEILVRVNIKQGNELKHKFELKGNISGLKELTELIVNLASDWVAYGK